MKTNLIFGLILLITIQAFTQTKWYKYPGKIDVVRGTDGEWDEILLDRDIIFEGNEYHMWYEGWSFDNPGRGKFGFATSADGIHWKKHPGNPLDFKDDNINWINDYWTFDIIRKDSMYLMWFTADSKDTSCSYGIGFAWSADGLSWNLHPEPVLTPGNGDSWDGYGVTNPNVIFDGKIFHMWFSGIPNRIPKILSIGYASSTDGIHWIKHPANPVLKRGKPGFWDDHWVVGYSVTTNGPLKEMWYFGFNQIKFEIGLATSKDGILWTKSSENPVLKTGKLGEWDAIVFCPRVIRQDSIYRMWYGGWLGIGYATSSRSEAKSWEEENIEFPPRIIRVRVFNRMEYINVDSLSQILHELSGTALIDAYNKLALAYSLNDDVKSYNYAEKALELAKHEGYLPGRAMALYSMGNSQYVMNNYTDALVNQLTALRIFDSLDMQLQVGNLLSQIASIHTYAGSHELACKYHQQALDVFIQLQDTAYIINTLNYLGESFLDAGETIQARKTFNKELILAKETEQVESIVFAYEGLGRSYLGYLLDSSIYYILEARKIYELKGFSLQTNNSILLAETYLAAGPVYNSEAKGYLQESFGLLKHGMGDAHNQLRWLFGMAELLISTGRYKEAKKYLDLSLELGRTFLSKHDDQIYVSLNEKLEFGVLLKEYMEKIYRLYYQLDIISGDLAAELQHFKLATAWKDSISNDQAWKKVAMIQANYEMEISRNQISILEKEYEVQNLTVKKSRIYLFGLGVFVLIVILGAIIFIRNRRVKAKQALEFEREKSEKLKELDQLKSRFFANISHEFRTPLTLIIGPLEKLLSKAKDNNEKKELSIAKKYTGKLQILINNILAISKLESGKMLLHTSETDIVKMVNTYIQSFESLAKQKNISFKFNAENKVINTFIDRGKFEQILNNLLSNAFKFTDEGGRIEVSLGNKMTTDKVFISVSDTGTGIPPEQLSHIFDRFYQVEHENSSYYEGTGIGLALTKELVELHHGIIQVDSEQGKGSTFTIMLPLGKKHLKPEEIVTSQQVEVSNQQLVTDPAILNLEPCTRHPAPDPVNDVPLILIVEDNADMRSYIRGYFENDFQIIEAIDGEDGYEKSIEHIPDIIISDVMMPKMDGIEFCGKIKKDERTSHIPVILLTARASKESRLEGLNTGADDFIIKPFDGDELQMRVKNLINQRMQLSAVLKRKIQKSYSVPILDFEDSRITSMDERFLQNVFKILEEQYADPQFNVNIFSKAVGVSKMQLHRKINALTQHSPGEFIRTYRLNVAAQLLRKQSGTVAEIAYDTGFNSPSYFAECFRKQFGLLPSEI